MIPEPAAELRSPSCDPRKTAREPAFSPRQSLTDEEVRAFAADAKIALLATLDDSELPHLTLISSLAAKSPERLMFGQFCAGASKSNLENDPRTGFLVLDASRRVWRGIARWCGAASVGEDYEAYNRKPMFRYNAYAGIHKVHYLDIVEVTAAETLPAVRAALGALLLKGAGSLTRPEPVEPVLKPWAARHFDAPRTLKFGALVDADGYPRIHAALRCATHGPSQVTLALAPFGTDAARIEDGRAVAILALNLEFESVLLRGRFRGYCPGGGQRAATLDVEWVYNSMPFKQGQIFPYERRRPVS